MYIGLFCPQKKIFNVKNKKQEREEEHLKIE